MSRIRRLAAALGLAACAAALACAPAARGPSAREVYVQALDNAAERYVKLALAVGEHDPDYIDAYYGPPAWRDSAKAAKAPLAELDQEAEALVVMLDADVFHEPAPDELLGLRRSYLNRQLASLRGRVAMLQGKRLSFDEESQALYEAVAPTHDEAYFQQALDELARVLPGSGPVEERYQAFRRRFVVPPEKVDTVFRAAVAACRERTLQHVELPAGESFRIEYVTGKPWSGYNWYQGNLRSLIQVNTSLPVYIDRALDLACHEGYPGHHVYNVLLEHHLVRGRGWVEYTVYPLFSPQSLIAEGSANYGIEIAFPGDQRVRFEREVLFPLAGLDPSLAAEYYRVQDLVRRVSYAGNEAARRYLDGEIDRAAAVDWLVRYALMSRPAAEQRTRFFDTYRSYVINYNHGQDLVKAWVEREAGPGATPERRWAVFTKLLASPRLPGDLGPQIDADERR